MKLKYILPAFIAAMGLMTTACDEEFEPTVLSEVQVSQSIVSLPTEGGSTTITVTATADWYFDELPEWLTVTPASGAAGVHEVTLAAGEAEETHDLTLKLVAGGRTQLIRVMQIAEPVQLPISSCAEVLAGPDANYRVKGTCTRIANTQYGNWYINDGTGELYIYGTLDAEGNSKNFESLGLEVGDVVIVEGPKSTYGTTVELVDVTVIDIEKAAN